MTSSLRNIRAVYWNAKFTENNARTQKFPYTIFEESVGWLVIFLSFIRVLNSIINQADCCHHCLEWRFAKHIQANIKKLFFFSMKSSWKNFVDVYTRITLAAKLKKPRYQTFPCQGTKVISEKLRQERDTSRDMMTSARYVLPCSSRVANISFIVSVHPRPDGRDRARNSVQRRGR